MGGLSIIIILILTNLILHQNFPMDPEYFKKFVELGEKEEALDRKLSEQLQRLGVDESSFFEAFDPAIEDKTDEVIELKKKLAELTGKRNRHKRNKINKNLDKIQEELNALVCQSIFKAK